MENEIIKIKNLFCGYQDTLVLKDVSLSIEKGDILGIAGPNGAGKTTFLRAITKILSVPDGAIMIHGNDLNYISQRELARKISVVPQETSPPFRIKVFEMIAMGRTPYINSLGWLIPSDLNKIEEISRIMDICHLLDRYFDELSGGEKQLVIFARCLTQEPEIMLLDEVTANLDVAHTINLFELIRKIHREKGITVISISHDINQILDLCSKVVLMKGGKVANAGLLNEVIKEDILSDVFDVPAQIKREGEKIEFIKFRNI